MVNLKLKVKLIERGLSQFEVCRKLGVSDSWFSKIMNGWLSCPEEIQVKLANLLNCEIHEIFDQESKD
jgi:transcriptional regulator with XRE-family HTH domain